MAEYNVDEYKVEGDGAEYNFKISLVDNKINLQLTEVSVNKRGKNYEGEFTLDELRQINRIFQLTSTIYEAQEEFKKAVERQKIALSENDAYVNIMFHMILGTDNAPFVIALPRNESARIIKLEQETDLLKLERDNLFDKLLIIKNNTEEITKNVRELENENSSLEQTTTLAEEEMKIPGFKISPQPIASLSTAEVNYNAANNNINTNLNNANSNNVLRNASSPVSLNNLSNNNSNIGNINMRYSSPTIFPCGIEKNIINDEQEIFFISKKISEYIGKNPTYNLLYRATTHGDTAVSFHSKCDKATMSLVLVKDNNGNRFGGFTTREWSGNCMQKIDDKAFIFSIDKAKIFNVIPGQTAIGCFPSFGPIFYGCQIRVYDNFFVKGGSTYLKGANYNTTMDYELTNGVQKFGINEIEVYEIK